MADRSGVAPMDSARSEGKPDEPQWPPRLANLDEQLRQVVPSSDDPVKARRWAIAQRMRERATRAEYLRYHNRVGRHRWRLVNYAFGFITVVSGAVAGSVLFAPLDWWQRWIVGLFSLAAAIASGLGVVLNPSGEWDTRRLRTKQYEALTRQIWDYMLIQLPTATIEDAESELTLITKKLEGISLETAESEAPAKTQ